MHEFGQGELKSHDKKVTDQKQALAIAFSEARKVYPNYGMMKKAGEVKDAAVKGLFSLDAIEGKKFPGYTFGDDWNGWATPYFEKPEANLIMEALGGTYNDGKYLFDDGYDGFDEYEKQTIETVDGPKDVYAIGAYSWTWDNDLMKNGGEVKRSSAGDKEGWHFVVGPNFTSALYKTKKEAEDKLDKYLETGKFDFYGTAEMHDGGSVGERAVVLAKIYKEGTAKQLWEAWTPENRVHFLLDHAVEFFELMGDNYTKSSNGFAVLSYDALPSPIKKSVLIHHAQGMYRTGGSIASRFWNTTKKHTKTAFEKSKELAGKGYEKTKAGLSQAKAYTEKKIHDQKKNIALDVLDETRGKVDSKHDSRLLNQAANFVEDIYAGGGEISDKLDTLYKKYSEKDYWGTKAVKENKLKEWELALSKGDKNAEKFTRQDIIDTYEKMDRAGFDYMVNKIKTRIDEKNTKELKSGIRYDQKLSQDIYELFTGKSLKGMNNKQLGEYFDQTYGTSMAGGGGADEGVDLFEDYDNIPPKVQKILDKYQEGIEGEDYQELQKAKDELEKIGYTFEFYLDGTAYDLRKIGQKGKVDVWEEKEKKKEKEEKKESEEVKAARKIAMKHFDTIDQKAAIEYKGIKFVKMGNKLIYVPTEEKLMEVLGLMAGGGAASEYKTEMSKINERQLANTLKEIKKAIRDKKTWALYDEYEDDNYHSENVILVTQTVGNDTDKQDALDIWRAHAMAGSIPDDAYQKRNLLSKKLWPKFVEYAKETEGIKMADGGEYQKREGGSIKKYNEGAEISSKLSPAKKKLLDRINTLKATKSNAGAAAQKAIQKKIDVLQKQFDYNPSAKERALANKGKYALDVPTKHSKFIYKKLWGMKILPRIHTLNGTSSIVVNSQINLVKAYRIYSDLLKEKGESVPPLSKIGRKL